MAAKKAVAGASRAVVGEVRRQVRTHKRGSPNCWLNAE